MNPREVFWAFLLLAGVWTLIWGAVLLRAGSAVPYPELAPRVARLRRRLLLVLGLGVAVIFFVSLRGLPYPTRRLAALGPPDVTVDVSGIQWTWQLNRTEVPAGAVVEFAVTAADVNHGIGIYDPRGTLLAQVQAMPGRTNRLLYRFLEPGQYALRCLEYCGIAHHAMVTPMTVTGTGGTP
jgi:cytochrome c oxidase subunit 2